MDRQIERLRERNVVEYEMAFMKPEAIKRITEKRKQQEQEELADNRKIFEQQVAQMFGKTLPSSG